MNREMRKHLLGIIYKLDELMGEIEAMGDQEQTKYDNMPEGFQNGEHGKTIEKAANALREAATSLHNVISSLGEI